jgi:hypothetical protein
MEYLTDTFNEHLFGAPVPTATTEASRGAQGQGKATAVPNPTHAPPGAIGEQAEEPEDPRPGADRR